MGSSKRFRGQFDSRFRTRTITQRLDSKLLRQLDAKYPVFIANQLLSSGTGKLLCECVLPFNSATRNRRIIKQVAHAELFFADFRVLRLYFSRSALEQRDDVTMIEALCLAFSSIPAS